MLTACVTTRFLLKKILIPGLDETRIAVQSSSHKKSSFRTKYSHDNEIYKFSTGDTLSTIAMQHGVEVADLMAWTHISDTPKLRVGRTLLIKGSSATVAKAKPIKSTQSNHEPVEFEEGSDCLHDDDSMFDLSEEISVVSVNQN